jgi:hypothetical protein
MKALRLQDHESAPPQWLAELAAVFAHVAVDEARLFTRELWRCPDCLKVMKSDSRAGHQCNDAIDHGFHEDEPPSWEAEAEPPFFYDVGDDGPPSWKRNAAPPFFCEGGDEDGPF